MASEIRLLSVTERCRVPVCEPDFGELTQIWDYGWSHAPYGLQVPSRALESLAFDVMEGGYKLIAERSSYDEAMEIVRSLMRVGDYLGATVLLKAVLETKMRAER